MSKFSLLSPHGHVLARIAADPHVRLGDIAETLTLTERSAQRIVSDLIEAGYVSRQQQSRRSTLALVAVDVGSATETVLSAERAATTEPVVESERTKKDDILARLARAVEAILQDGETFGDISVERLIRAAGISRSTFYAYFRDKDDLLQALTEGVLKEVEVASRRWTDLGAGLTKEDLQEAFGYVGAVHLPHRLLMRSAAEADPTNTAVRSQYDDFAQHSLSRISEHIVRGQREGFVRRDANAKDAAQLIFWGAELRLNAIPADATPSKHARVLQALTGMVWNLLYVDADQGANT